MQLTVTDGNTPRTLTLTALEITNIDTEADTISGTTDFSDWVRVCVNQPGNCVTRWATPDGEGNRTVDYTIASGLDDDTASVNLKPGMDGWAEQYDSANNATHADWKVLNPFVEASVAATGCTAAIGRLAVELTLTIAGTSFSARRLSNTIPIIPAILTISAPFSPLGNFQLDSGMPRP